MKHQRIVRLFLASPGDVEDERRILREVVEELNQTWSDFVGLVIQVRGWETYAWPSIGEDAQAVINDQLGIDYDIFTGILKERTGTPTPRAASGTIEEYERALAAYRADGRPEIMFYFQQVPTVPHEIRDFKKRLASEGVLYWEYGDSRHFEQASRIHLSRQIQQLARKTPLQATDRPLVAPDEVDMRAALTTGQALAKQAIVASKETVAAMQSLQEKTGNLAETMNSTTRRIRQASRPGFRKRPGAARGAVRDLEAALLKYSDELEQLRPDLRESFQQMMQQYGRSLAAVAPFHPLPALLRPTMARTVPQIDQAQRNLSKLRKAAASVRDAIAEWGQVDRGLTSAQRQVVAQLDHLDLDLSATLLLTREIQREAQEFLDSALLH